MIPDWALDTAAGFVERMAEIAEKRRPHRLMRRAQWHHSRYLYWSLMARSSRNDRQANRRRARAARHNAKWHALNTIITELRAP